MTGNYIKKSGFYKMQVGAAPGPFDCFLVLRGIKTLAVRMERHADNAMKIAQFLESHSKVRNVVYPGLESHPQHELAREPNVRFWRNDYILYKRRIGVCKETFLKRWRYFHWQRVLVA